MSRLTLVISNVNVYNHDYLTDIAGIAGYAASLELVDETTYSINVQKPTCRADQALFCKMLKTFKEYNFGVSAIN